MCSEQSNIFIPTYLMLGSLVVRPFLPVSAESNAGVCNSGAAEQQAAVGESPSLGPPFLIIGAAHLATALGYTVLSKYLGHYIVLLCCCSPGRAPHAALLPAGQPGRHPARPGGAAGGGQAAAGRADQVWSTSSGLFC